MVYYNLPNIQYIIDIHEMHVIIAIHNTQEHYSLNIPHTVRSAPYASHMKMNCDNAVNLAITYTQISRRYNVRVHVTQSFPILYSHKYGAQDTIKDLRCIIQGCFIVCIISSNILLCMHDMTISGRMNVQVRYTYYL